MSENINSPLILIAEDNLVNQKVIVAILKMNGYKFEIVQDGVEAVSKYNPDRFDLILMDCQMPKMDGLKATENIRLTEEKMHWKRCPIVALTANAMRGDFEKCVAVGMDDFLSKPFKSSDLIGKINLWIGRNS